MYFILACILCNRRTTEADVLIVRGNNTIEIVLWECSGEKRKKIIHSMLFQMSVSDLHYRRKKQFHGQSY